jgi:RNA polymerase sigma-70 factor (ECF subfamily)
MAHSALCDELDAMASGPRVVARKDDARLRELLAEHFSFVWRSLRRFGLSEDRADDAAQQVFLVLSRRLDDVSPGSERAFLLRTAMHVASDVRRSAGFRREVSDPDPAGELPSTLETDGLVEQRRARELLDRALDAIEFDLRTVFVLYEVEEMTVGEIADLLAIPYGTVGSRLRRAREKFHAAVARIMGKEKHGE